MHASQSTNLGELYRNATSITGGSAKFRQLRAGSDHRILLIHIG